MQSVSLYDKLTLRAREKGIEVLSDYSGIPSGRENTCYRAAEIFFRESNISGGIEIKIDKAIPVGAGLGGASSDASATFIGMSRLFGLKVPFSSLLRWAEMVGADVPFCLKGGTALVRGKGEKLVFLPPARKGWVVLLNPGIPLSTRWVYEKLRVGLTRKRLNVKLLAKSLRENGLCGVSPFLYNRLEEVVFKRFPSILEVKEEMRKTGAMGTLMTGSGSTIFAIVEDEKSGIDILNKMQRRGRAYLVQPVDKSLKEG